MRVSENSINNAIESSLVNTRSRMEKLQKQASTLKRINKPSDDPVGNIQSMRVRSGMLDSQQFQQNASLAKNFLHYTDTALAEALEITNKSKDLAIQMSSDAANGPDTRRAVAEEVDIMRKQLLALANRRLGERYIFGGFQTTGPPFSGNGQYLGDDGSILVEVDRDIYISMNIPGKDIFQGGEETVVSSLEVPGATLGYGEESSSRPNDANIFVTLSNFSRALKANDVAGIQSTLEVLDQVRNRLITRRAQVSTRVAGIEASLENIGKREADDAALQSFLEDADVARVVSDLAKEETAFKASLSAAHKLNQLKLIDFLK